MKVARYHRHGTATFCRTRTSSYAVQLAKQAGAVVTATASPRSADRLRGYGADRIIDYIGHSGHTDRRRCAAVRRGAESGRHHAGAGRRPRECDQRWWDLGRRADVMPRESPAPGALHPGLRPPRRPAAGVSSRSCGRRRAANRILRPSPPHRAGRCARRRRRRSAVKILAVQRVCDCRGYNSS